MQCLTLNEQSIGCPGGTGVWSRTSLLACDALCLFYHALCPIYPFSISQSRREHIFLSLRFGIVTQIILRHAFVTSLKTAGKQVGQQSSNQDTHARGRLRQSFLQSRSQSTARRPPPSLPPCLARSVGRGRSPTFTCPSFDAARSPLHDALRRRRRCRRDKLHNVRVQLLKKCPSKRPTNLEQMD